MKSTQKTMALWAALIVLAIVLYNLYDERYQTTIRDFSFSKFMLAVEGKELKDNAVTINESTKEFSGEMKAEFKEKYGGATHFRITGNSGDFTLEQLRKNGITPNYISGDGNSFLQSMFVSWLPLLIIFFMFMFFMRQIQAGGGKAMSFGKSRAKLLTENKNKVTFADVAGVEEAKDDLKEIIDFLKSPKKYVKLGGKIPKGVLLVGSPGTGKTLLARAVAGEAGVPFFSISGSDFVEMFVGVGASRVRDLFEQGKKHAPCIIFVDEIDAVGRHRGAGLGGGHDEREQTLNQLLVEMDGFEGNDGVIIVAATNRPDVLDPALLRPGRFDRRVIVGKPDLSGRLAILKVHTRKTPLATEVDLDKVAKGTPGFSGADLANLVNEAALLAARKNKSVVDMYDFEEAKDKVMLGPERKSMKVSEHDRKVTAYHEAGHTLVGKHMPTNDPIHKVTIIPRGMALGVTHTLPDEESVSLTRNKARNLLAFLFGGRAAEEIIFKDFTTGASNDIECATDIARRMVCEWGMSDKLGPLKYENRDNPVFLGMTNGRSDKEYSDETGREIDAEIRKLVTFGHQEALRILNDHRTELDRLAIALLELETLDGKEIDEVISGTSIADIVKSRELRQKDLEDQNRQQEDKNIKAEEEQANALKKAKGGGHDPSGMPGPVTT